MGGAELLKNEELLLTALSGGSELYGLQILKLIEKASDGEVIINYGSLYPLLKKLEKKGYVKSRWEDNSSRQGPRRRYYRVTETGIELATQSQLLRERLKQLAIVKDVDRLFDFEVVTVNLRGEIIKRETKQAEYFTENLGNGVTLDMVAIPGGKFLMGAPKDEKGSNDSEKPQHQVTIQPFFIGKFPVTQAQWRAVANLPEVDRDLNSNPSYFKGNNCPVEKVSWYDAVEFCQRLSRETGREYRLPSEAEWEYACRAETTTPFYFGETITSKLANYAGSKTYASEPKGEFRKQTTDVGTFPPNAFGLYDMHGNVWEWCADAWHENYQGAPTDGSAWEDNSDDNKNQYQVLRGGSWDFNPNVCRSAIRLIDIPGNRDYYVGFRVACGVAGLF